VRISIHDPEANAAPASREDDERRAKQQRREQIEKDPFVQQALRTFRGEVADIQTVEPKR
jgi:hypothetical protein